MSRKSVLEMTHHVLMAHGKAVKVLRDYAPEAKVGIAPTSTVACPATEKPEDVEAARKAYFDVIDQENYMWSVSWWSDPVFFGKYPEEGVKLFAGDMPCIGEQDMELISQPVDFYGQNIYNGYPVASDGKGGYSLSLIHICLVISQRCLLREQAVCCTSPTYWASVLPDGIQTPEAVLWVLECPQRKRT